MDKSEVQRIVREAALRGVTEARRAEMVSTASEAEIMEAAGQLALQRAGRSPWLGLLESEAAWPVVESLAGGLPREKALGPEPPKKLHELTESEFDTGVAALIDNALTRTVTEVAPTRAAATATPAPRSGLDQIIRNAVSAGIARAKVREAAVIPADAPPELVRAVRKVAARVFTEACP